LKGLKQWIAAALVAATLSTSALAAPVRTIDVYTDTPVMQYLKLSQIDTVLKQYHLDSGYNDSPMLRAYQTVTGNDKELSHYALRKALISFFAKDDANYVKLAKVMCGQFDAYSAFLSKDEYNEAFPASNNYDGLGITVRAFGGTLVITEVHENSAAEQAGLAENDRIVAIGDTDLRLLDYADSMELMSDAAKKPCTITVRKYIDGAELVVDMVPAPIVIPNIEVSMLESEIGYMKINRFSGWEFIAQLNDAETFLRDNKAQKLVLDLRDNPGGDLTLLLIAMNFMIKDENVPLFEITSRTGTDRYTSTGRGLPFDDIAVLVNGSSASSSEVLAGVLSDTGYATIIGTTTYGKARGQTTLQLPDDYLAHLSLSEVTLPVRGKYHGKGLTPDIVSDLKKTYVLSQDDLTNLGEVYAGSPEKDILKLQKCLFALGYLGTFEPGIFDDNTREGLQVCMTAMDEPMHGVCSAEFMSKIGTACKAYIDAYFTEDTQITDALAYLKNA